MFSSFFHFLLSRQRNKKDEYIFVSLSMFLWTFAKLLIPREREPRGDVDFSNGWNVSLILLCDSRIQNLVVEMCFHVVHYVIKLTHLLEKKSDIVFRKYTYKKSTNSWYTKIILSFLINTYYDKISRLWNRNQFTGPNETVYKL